MRFAPQQINPFREALGTMLNNFHPLFRGIPTPSYTPYLGFYWNGTWNKTKRPMEKYTDGWVLPNRSGANGEQLYVTREKQPGTIRIITLGGSTMAGVGQSSYEKSIPGYLQAKLSAAYPGKHFEVVMGGYVALVSAEEMVALSTKLIDYHPDLILVMDGFNDFSRAWQYPDLPPFCGTQQEFFTSTFARTQTLRGALSQLAYVVSEYFYSAAMLRTARYLLHKKAMSMVGAGRDTSIGAMQKVFGDAIEHYLMTHRSIMGIAQAHHVPVILAYQPSVFYRKPLTADEKKIVADPRVDSRYAQGAAYYFSQGDQAYERFRKEEISSKVQLMNLAGLFEKDNDAIYTDFCHYNDRGAEIISRAFVPEISKLLGLTRDRSQRARP
jgi:lysophospholipase L1-like esterase